MPGLELGASSDGRGLKRNAVMATASLVLAVEGQDRVDDRRIRLRQEHMSERGLVHTGAAD